MHPWPTLTHGNAAYGLPGVAASLALLLLGFWGLETLVPAIPGITRQIVQPCAGCYLGAFGPPLEPYRHPFGQSDDTAAGAETPPAAMTLRTPGSQPDGAGRWLALNGTVAVDWPSLIGAGRFSQNAAAFLAPGDGRLAREFHGSDVDVRSEWAVSRLESDTVSGGTMNDSPMVWDSWNPMPVWSFPDYRLHFASTWGAAALTDATSGSAAAGLGAGAPWKDSRQIDLMGYRGLEYDVLNAIGFVPAGAAPWIQGSIPYWRVAVQKDLARHFLQIGTYGMNADLAPAGSQSAGTTDTFTNLGAEVNYQFIVNPGGDASDRLFAHAALTHETRSPGASNRVLGVNGFNTLDSFHADASWSFSETITPSIQYFRTAGSAESVRSPWPAGRPNSAGVIGEIAYVPWGKVESPLKLLNLRLAAQYVAYTEFNGTGRGASGNNAVYLSLWGALYF